MQGILDRLDRPARFAWEPLLLTRWFLYAFVRIVSQIVLFMICFQIYKLVRKTYIQRAQDVAFGNALDILRLERWLHLDPELRMQKFVLEHHSLIWFFNRYYTYFMTGFYICAGLAMILAPQRYLYLRRVFLTSMVLALPWYALYPLAPPRFMQAYGYNFVDTLLVYGPNYFSDSGLVQANHYAAMPSMHCGWTLIGSVMLAAAIPKWRIGLILGTTHTLMMFTTVMVTGNHYLLDIVGGVMVAGAAFVVAYYLPAWRQSLRQRLFPAAQPLAQPAPVGVTVRAR